MQNERNHQYYIHHGAKNNFFTLRLYYQEAVWSMNSYHKYYISEWRDRDYHVRNLTTKSYEIALEKAREVCKEKGYNFVINPEMAYHKTEAIKILTPEEREIKAMLLARLQRHNDEMREARGFRNAMDTMFEKVKQGRLPYGISKGDYIHPSLTEDQRYVASQGYLFNLYKKPESEDIKWVPLNAKLKEKIAEYYPSFENALHVESNGEYFGEVKKRIKDVRAMLIAEFQFEGYYGMTYIQKFVTEGGEAIVYKGSSPKDFIIGEWVTLKFTVKSHEEYRGEKQTNITRIAWQHEFTDYEIYLSVKACVGLSTCKADIKYALGNSFDGLWKYEIPKALVEFCFKTLNNDQTRDTYFKECRESLSELKEQNNG